MTSKLLGAGTTLIVLVFFPGLHQSLFKELGQSSIYDLSAWVERRKRSVFFQLAKLISLIRNTSKYTSLAWIQRVQEREGRSTMAGVPVLSQATSTTSRCLFCRSKVLLQESQYLSYQRATKDHTEQAAMLLRDPTPPRLKISGSMGFLGAETCFFFHIRA